MKYRGIIHFHSKYSYDSIISIKEITRFALKNNLNFICLTDHETIKGSKKLQQYIKSKKLAIQVIIGAEYKTSLGDIIALNIKKDIKSMQFDEFIKEARQQDGVLLFPHPYKGHKNIEYIAQKIDMIEIFNSRLDKKNNDKSYKLAKKYNKNTYCSSDAHTYMSLKNCILEFDSVESNFIEALLDSNIKCLSCKNSFYYEVIYSQVIKAIKNKSYKLIVNQIKQFIKLMLKFKLFQRIF